jgi:CheY-like chemotaxis protein
LSGIELIKAVKEVRQDLPIILCTGYNKLISEANAHSLGIRQVLMKPFGIETLARAVRQNLLPEQDRRQLPRFKAADDVYVISQSSPTQRLSLLDFGLAGLAYRQGMEALLDDATDIISIMADSGTFYIPGILCRNVSCVAIAGLGTAYTRRSVVFESPSIQQRELLTQLIENYSVPQTDDAAVPEIVLPPLQMTA